MLDMTNAPLPTAMPAIAPGFRLEPLLSTSVGGRAGSGDVVLDRVVVLDGDAAVKGTPINEASDDAYSTGKLFKSLLSQTTHTGPAVAVPDRTSVGGYRIVVNEKGCPPDPLGVPEHISVVKSTATTVVFPESQRRHEELTVAVKDV